MNVLKKEHIAKQTTCARCGICCEKGGPAFHGCDRPILESGRIVLADLYTLRKGEPVFDNVANRPDTAPTDILKIRSANGMSACLFYQRADRSCGVYADRPLECRVLECWNPDGMAAIYQEDRLARKDLISGLSDLWEMVLAHEEVCAYARLSQSVKEKNWEAVAYCIRYDFQVRRLMVEKGNMDDRLFDFLFGMPLTVTLQRYGLSPQQIRNMVEG
ncbi:YkgJ family cysteine cluster protein [Desulfosudis oleivorans]|uniref:YkgJ family cysteine cluster protein n=1 Tax=Desulfosudis oleivorans (strain DSM 6200 / JCM 39069 / Hxd3) TaxID=96561 RepID=A8ZZF6_DESOH|nr:YkgJ family cysteine cluster protein [Desulfosudis oleivorans]ABW67309.1 conserved hypothetical protein [Desulfosudis oleivorans Hxd3]